MPQKCQRVVIDATHDLVMLHYTEFADERLLEIVEAAVRIEETKP